MPRAQVDTRPYISEWATANLPSANVRATVTQAAPAAGSRLVLMGLAATIANGTTAPAAANVTLNVIDGASGGTTYLFRATISNNATAGDTVTFSATDLSIAATAATALTVEFNAASGANTNQSVSAWGYTTSD